MIYKTDKYNNTYTDVTMFAPILLSKDEYENGGIAARRREIVDDLNTHGIFYDDLYGAISPVVDYDDEVLDALDKADAETIMRGIDARMEMHAPVSVPSSDEENGVVALNALMVVNFETIVRALIGDERFEGLAAAC